MNKPIILAFCGKSATGKDTVTDALSVLLPLKGYASHMIISDTTRKRRIGEKDGINYNYLTTAEFRGKQRECQYLESSFFGSWWYGTPKSAIRQNAINIGVFNLDGLISLSHYLYEYTIIPIYLESDLETRLERSYNREGRWRFEHFRRVFADWRDFRRAKKILNMYPKHISVLENPMALRTNQETPETKAKYIIWKLQDLNVLGKFG